MKNVDIKKLFNENQIEYIKKSNEKLNVKLCGLASGAYYLDTKFTIFKRANDLKEKEGICLLIFPSMQTARNRFGKIGINIIGKGDIYCGGYTFKVATESGNPNRLKRLLTSKLKYVYGSDINEWKEDTFNHVIHSVKEQNCIFDGVIYGLKSPQWISDFINNEESLYIQDNFTTENNGFLSKSQKDYLHEILSKKHCDGLFKSDFIKKQD